MMMEGTCLHHHAHTLIDCSRSSGGSWQHLSTLVLVAATVVGTSTVRRCTPAISTSQQQQKHLVGRYRRVTGLQGTHLVTLQLLHLAAWFCYQRFAVLHHRQNWRCSSSKTAKCSVLAARQPPGDSLGGAAAAAAVWRIVLLSALSVGCTTGKLAHAAEFKNQVADGIKGCSSLSGFALLQVAK